MLLRGLFRRCAWCGGKGAFFTSWYGKGDRCRTCGLNWQRNLEGFELGAATMGVFITFGSIIVWMIVSVLTGVALVPLLVVAGVIAVIFPIAFTRTPTRSGSGWTSSSADPLRRTWTRPKRPSRADFARKLSLPRGGTGFPHGPRTRVLDRTSVRSYSLVVRTHTHSLQSRVLLQQGNHRKGTDQ